MLQAAKDPNRERRICVFLTQETHKKLKLESVQADRLLKDVARDLIESHFNSRLSNEKN